MLPFVEIMKAFNEEINEQSISVDEKKIKEYVITSEYKDKVESFFIGSRQRLNSILWQFIIIGILYLALGVYSIIDSSQFYNKVDFSSSITRNSAFRIPYMTMMVASMRQEMLTMQNLLDYSKNKIFDTYYEKFKANEIEFSQFNERYTHFYPKSVEVIANIQTDKVCQVFLSDVDRTCKCSY